MPPRGNWFIGFPVLADRWFDAILRVAPPALKRFHRADLHATVAFLGSCGESRALAAWAALPERCGPPMSAVLDRLAPFGPRSRPSALSLTLAEGCEEVAARIGALRGPLYAAAEVPGDERPPLPHITVLRPRRAATPRERREAIAFAESLPPLGIPVRFDRVALYAWSEDRRERQFQVVMERELA